MSVLPFTLRQLEIFASLCATGSFGRTAKEMGISQASVSSQIRQLESQLGTSLFLRRPGKPSHLTREGAAFLKDFQHFELAARQLATHRRKAISVLDQVSYRIRVGQGLFDNYIRPRLSGFLARHPAIDLQFEATPPASQLSKAVLGGQYNFALFHARDDEDVPPMMQEIARVCGGIYGHTSFAADQCLPLRQDLLSDFPFILPKAGSAQEQDVLRTLRFHNIMPKHVVCNTPYFDVMATLLTSGAGVASFSSAILLPEQRENVVLLYPLVNWKLLWFRKDPVPDPRADALQEFLFSCVLDNPDYPMLPS